MFDSLSDRFDKIFSKLRSKGRLSEADVELVLREIRVALLDADVNIDVVKTFQERVRVKCIGADLSKALSPSQQVIKFVNEELTNILGGAAFKLTYASHPPTIILLAGLQGSGKTTTAGKLANWFKRQGRNPLLVAADLQRPAAVEQLRVLGSQVGVPVFSEPTDPVSVTRSGLQEAIRLGRDVLIVDTAGRLSIDVEMMEQVRQISEALNPHFTFLVINAMTGQDAVQTAESFNDTLSLSGVIVTKLDGDSRGGACLSVKEVVGKPIAFASTGEKLSDFDQFYPDRMASRILGMGDMLTLIETAERTFDADVAADSAAKLMEGRLTLEDFLAQLQQIKKMGPLKGVLGLMPGIPKEIKNADIDEGQLTKTEAIIRSMTPKERVRPEVIDGSRRLRIAKDSGTTTTDVNNLLKQFKEMQKMMKSMGFGPSQIRRASKGKKGGKSKGKSRGPTRTSLPTSKPMSSISGIRELISGPGSIEALSKQLEELGSLEDVSKLRLPE